MSLTLAAVATGIMLAASIAAEIDSAIRAKNAKKARRLNAQLNAVTRKYNLTQNNLDEAMRRVNLNYDNLMTALYGVSRAGKAKTIQDQALVEYKDKMNKLNQEKQRSQDQYESVSGYLSQQISSKENKGLYDTLGGLIK